MGRADSLSESLIEKSLWRMRRGPLWSFFCPLCRVPRRVRFRKRPGGFGHFSQVGLTAIVFSMATWRWFGVKGLVSFIPIWTVFEVIYRLRMRAALRCDQCGFDPYLFLLDENKAKVEIENHWRKKYEEKGIPFPEKEKNAQPVKRPPLSPEVPLTEATPKS
jgi:hypothetical protein